MKWRANHSLSLDQVHESASAYLLEKTLYIILVATAAIVKI
jgi:hypothetical protein